jgi:hypothetical protein
LLEQVGYSGYSLNPIFLVACGCHQAYLKLTV